MKKITVKAREGLRVPIPGLPGQFITDVATEVEANTYYLRRLSEGDLIKAQPVVKGKTDSKPDVPNNEGSENGKR